MAAPGKYTGDNKGERRSKFPEDPFGGSGRRTPGILLAAPASGSGKTAAACALMAAFQGSGMCVRACKCGPDYIDPMFHKEVLGIDSKNLDLFFSEKEELVRGYQRHTEGADIAVTEGVMGYYDGMALDTERASSYDVARTLGLPVLLVLPARGAALSLAAVVKGMAEFRKDSNIQGILLNRVSDMLYPRLREMLERELRGMDLDIPVIGYLPEDSCFRMESRHLGLVTPQEMEGLKAQIQSAGEVLRRTVDLELVRRIAGKTAEITVEPDGEYALKGESGVRSGSGLRIGIARDEAFCFYYKDNLALLEELGCTLIPFSPLRDRKLPEDLDGLLLGGGYPELHGKELAENRDMLSSVRNALQDGMPCLAECGGFMYLHEEMEDKNGNTYPMAGVIKGRTYPTGRLVRFGYVNIAAAPGEEEESAVSCSTEKKAYLRPGEQIRGHEFHYWDSTDCGNDCVATKPDGKRKWECIHMNGNLFAGYPHLYLPSMPEFAYRFADRCRDWMRQERK